MAAQTHPYISNRIVDTTGEEQEGTSEDIIIEKFTATRTVTNNKATKPLVFPTNLDPSRYMALNFIPSTTLSEDLLGKLVTGDRNTFASSIVEEASSKGSISSAYLPIPNSISEGVSHNWEMQSTNTVDALGSKFNLYADAKKLIAVTARTSVDSANLQTYSGTGARSFTFDYMLTPRNAEDATKLKEMLLFIKAKSRARAGTKGLTLDFPDMVNIIFREKDSAGNTSVGNNFFEDVLEATLFVVESINTNFSPDGNMTLFDDGTPKQVSLSITVKEFTPKLNDPKKEIGA